MYEGVERAGFYGFPVIHEAGEEDGAATKALVKELSEAGFDTGYQPYPNLHTLPLFAKGFDVFTRNRGPLCASEGYEGYAPGDFPNAERAANRTIFLPRLSAPAPDAADVVLEALAKAVAKVAGSPVAG